MLPGDTNPANLPLARKMSLVKILSARVQGAPFPATEPAISFHPTHPPSLLIPTSPNTPHVLVEKYLSPSPSLCLVGNETDSRRQLASGETKGGDELFSRMEVELAEQVLFMDKWKMKQIKQKLLTS